LKLIYKDVEYIVDKLPLAIQEMVGVYKRFEMELSDARIEVFKLEGAMKSTTQEIDARMEAQLELQVQLAKDKRDAESREQEKLGLDEATVARINDVMKPS
jgi:hypothetical protein